MALDLKSATLIADVGRQLADLTPEKVLAASPETIAAALEQLRAVVDTARTVTAPQGPLTASEAVAAFAAVLIATFPKLDATAVDACLQSFIDAQHLGTLRPGYEALIVDALSAAAVPAVAEDVQVAP